MRNKRLTLAAPPPDPFGEHERATFSERLELLGGRFEFETDDRRLRELVQTAYRGLPPHKLVRNAPRFRLRLIATPVLEPMRSRGEPPPVRGLAGPGLLCGTMGSSSFVTVAAAQRAALLVASQQALQHPYHLRYELLEFAVYLLAARAQRLVPLHAGCVGRDGRGVLLMGPSGSGKSTAVLHCLLAGLDFLAEDSVLVQPETLHATGIASFLHIRPDSLRFLVPARRATLLRSSTLIRRRSGVEKLEIDMRRPAYRLAPAPLTIRDVVFLSRGRAGKRGVLTRLPASTVLGRLASQQRYASQQPGWRVFCRRISRLPGYELRRGSHPRVAVEALDELLARR
jgi:energy-coupling factor transporter ATP-binding protein EcfA2